MADDPVPTASSPAGRRLHLRRSVRVRITLTAVAVTAAAVGIAGWLLVWAVESSQISELRDDIDDRLDEVAARLAAGEDPDDVLEDAGWWPMVQISDQDGRTISGSGPIEGAGSLFTDIQSDPDDEPDQGEGGSRRASGEVGGGPPEMPPPVGDGEPVPPTAAAPDVTATMTGDRNGTVEVRLGNGAVVTFEMVSRTVETPSGTMTVSGASPVEQVARSVDALRRALVIGLPALVVLVAVIAWVLVGRALRPVEAIRAEVDEITGRTMHRRVPEPPTGDEIGRLARTMNAMLGRLDAATTRQRQFVSDASHELRSPVAAIRTRLEVARRNPDRANWPAVADAALAEEARLESLLDDLLLLAAADETGTSPVKAKPVDLAALAAAEAERPRQVPVEASTGTGPAVVHGDADQLVRAVGNLLDNAARYAKSIVSLGVAQHDGLVRLTVDDDGPGIPEQDRERVFERFTRLDGSRTRHSGGAGLGLAVVRSIVTRHRGKVWAETNHQGGAHFTIELPTASR